MVGAMMAPCSQSRQRALGNLAPGAYKACMYMRVSCLLMTTGAPTMDTRLRSWGTSRWVAAPGEGGAHD